MSPALFDSLMEMATDGGDTKATGEMGFDQLNLDEDISRQYSADNSIPISTIRISTWLLT